MSAQGPWRITFDTNPDDCNFSCIMCEDHSPYSQTQVKRKSAGKPRRLMNIALIRKILEETKGSNLKEIIPSTMGEPLLYRQFDQIIAMCHEFQVKLNLTTNGSFPGKGALKWAEILVPVCSDIKISWNGATKEIQEKIMIGSNYEKVLENIKTLILVRDTYAQLGGNRCRVTMQITFLEDNVEELPDMIKLASRLGVDRVKGHHLWVHFTKIKGLSMRRSTESITKWNHIVDQCKAVAETHRLPNGKMVLLENIEKLSEESAGDRAPSGECPFLGKEAWVAHDGRFNPCCAPDYVRHQLGDFGFLQDQSLFDAWNSPKYLDLQKNYPNHSLCKTCNMRKPSHRIQEVK